MGKIDNFLPSRPGRGIVFQKGPQARLALLTGDARPGPRPLGKGRLSDCVGGQAVSGRHGCLSRRMALRMVRSLRAAAMATSILGLPASMGRWRKALRTGL